MAKHTEICIKTSKKKRKTFDMTKKRVAGTDAEKFTGKKGGKKGGGVAAAAAAKVLFIPYCSHCVVSFFFFVPFSYSCSSALFFFQNPVVKKDGKKGNKNFRFQSYAAS